VSRSAFVNGVWAGIGIALRARGRVVDGADEWMYRSSLPFLLLLLPFVGGEMFDHRFPP
jgi:hypothetical protein